MASKRAFFAVMLVAGSWACSDDDDGSRRTNPATGEDASMPGAADGGGQGNAGASGDPDAGGGGQDLLPDDVALPIVFVHGFAGSAQQYTSQAMRFEDNGWPKGRIRAYEHHGGMSGEDFVGGLNTFVDAVLAEFEIEKVYLVGHSRGTSVSSSFLGDPARAAKIAKYISLDGSGCDAAMTAGVPCIAPNQALLNGQAHVEVATSAESFVMQYEFLVGAAPATSAIVAQEGPVVISGRAVNFPENTGRAGATLEVWAIESDTGARAGDEPLATFEIGSDGNWGPVTVDPDAHYELVLLPAEGNQHHFYMQRFLRDTSFVRLLSGPPDAPARMNTNTGDTHSALIVSRMREWRTSDILEIETTSESGGDQPVVNAIAAGVGSDAGFGRIGIHIHDDAATPMESSLALLPWFPMQPFQSGVDVFMPAADPPDGTITLTNMPRGDTTKPQVLNIRNWRSNGHLISVGFADYAQD